MSEPVGYVVVLVRPGAAPVLSPLCPELFRDKGEAEGWARSGNDDAARLGSGDRFAVGEVREL